MLAITLYRPSPVLIMVCILSLPQIMRAWKYDPKAPENVAYYGVAAQAKLDYGAAYLALTGFLAVMTYELPEMLGATPTADAQARAATRAAPIVIFSRIMSAIRADTRDSRSMTLAMASITRRTTLGLLAAQCRSARAPNRSSRSASRRATAP
ncbi:MAG TPA: hypothetical protein VGG01_26970, partial [Xanthobacteraceae bacterium]